MGDVKPDVNTVAADAPQHLHIKIKSQEGDQIEFKVKPTTKFEKVWLLCLLLGERHRREDHCSVSIVHLWHFHVLF
jgi:hypothetical protein